MKKKATKKKAAKRQKKAPTFEESIDIVDAEIIKRRNRWNLTSLNWMDYDDVSQIIRIHIWEKWHMYDPDKPLGPWLNRIITNQIKNLIRNNYGNYIRPCLKCAAAEGESGCRIYAKQDASCPLFARWEKSKKNAYNIKIPLPIESHSHEINSMEFENTLDLEKNAKILHRKMQEILKPIEWKIYEAIYVKGREEKDIAKELGYKTSEANRNPGYKQIKNIKKSIIKKVKKFLEKGEVDLF